MMKITPEEGGLSGCSHAKQQRGFREEDGRPGPRYAVSSSVLGARSWDADPTARQVQHKEGRDLWASIPQKQNESPYSAAPLRWPWGQRKSPKMWERPLVLSRRRQWKWLHIQDFQVVVGLILGLDFHNLLHAKRKKNTLWQRSHSHTLWSAPWQFAMSQVSWLEETESEFKVRPQVQ